MAGLCLINSWTFLETAIASMRNGVCELTSAIDAKQLQQGSLEQRLSPTSATQAQADSGTTAIASHSQYLRAR